jgi:hypothetical protein
MVESHVTQALAHRLLFSALPLPPSSSCSPHPQIGLSYITAYAASYLYQYFTDDFALSSIVLFPLPILEDQKSKLSQPSFRLHTAFYEFFNGSESD